MLQSCISASCSTVIANFCVYLHFPWMWVCSPAEIKILDPPSLTLCPEFSASGAAARWLGTQTEPLQARSLSQISINISVFRPLSFGWALSIGIGVLELHFNDRKYYSIFRELNRLVKLQIMACHCNSATI